MMRTLLAGVAALLLIAPGPPRAARGADPDTAAQFEFFESRIRPVLVEKCYSCHNTAQTAQGGLAVDHRRALLKGGDGGAVIVPGKPDESSLLPILRHEVEGLKMPRDGSQLDPAVIADFAKWIEMGALDPRDAAPTADELTVATSWEAKFAKRKAWWSFQPVGKPPIPTVRNPAGASHAVDLFLQAKQEEHGLMPAGPADRQSLLRRVTFALTGLPPTPEEIKVFQEDTTPEAYSRVVDRLLASPRYGERWARHWMDLVRYCESHGSQGDPELPNAWRYRDYLIRAFNDDVPYDQLVLEHLAGDLLPEPRWNLAERFNESAIGAAHLRMVELGYIPVDALEDQVKVVDNQIDVVSKAFLGLTVSCARCHDHKFDPISQEDFYALYGIFASCHPGQIAIDPPELLRQHRDQLSALKQTIREQLAKAWLEAAEQFGDRLREQSLRAAQNNRLTERLRQLRESIADIEEPARARVMRGRGIELDANLPAPDSRWSFEGDARDLVGSHHGELLGGAVVRDGRLRLNGVDAAMTTVPLERDYLEKTLEAWVALSNFDQRGGGVIGLETPEGAYFDSIVFGEIKPRHWLAGSDFFRRTREPGGSEETGKPGELIHLAIVYQNDNSITVYRNGERYGATYEQGTLHRFPRGASRFLFGYRLSNANPPLACEIEEARAYGRALSADEVAASYRAGAAGVSPEELAAALCEADREQLSLLHAERERLQAELAALQPAGSEVPWRAALADARTNTSNPLHAWCQCLTDDGAAQSAAEFQERWRKLVALWRDEEDARRGFNSANFITLWELRSNDFERWSRWGAGLEHGQSNSGDFSIEVEGDRVIAGILPWGVFTHTLSRRQPGVLLSPRFTISTDSIGIRALGQNSTARLVIENYPLGNGGIYPAVRLNRDEAGWLRLDTSYRKGARAYFEFVTDATDRAFFGVMNIVVGDHSEVPREWPAPIQFLLGGDSPAVAESLATLYVQKLRQAISAWNGSPGDLTERPRAFLNYFVRVDLLPATLSRLPHLNEAVARYRALEREIPLPRRAPGVVEIEPFDQPLFVRGQHTRPAQPVARRGLSLLDSSPFATRDSGRLHLARQIASPRNPLLARVMVNRLWHHLFGRGLVATVDNLGHLGNTPTHPELLDYLAAKFVDDGWSIKTMLRSLVTSQAFQQSSRPSTAAGQLDPSNLLLSHMPVRRLEAEAIRDAMLAASEQLDGLMYGPGVNVYYVAKTEGGGPKGPLDGDRRRSIFLRIRRNAHNPFLEAFDAPKPSSTRGKRDVTNVPLQSLTMLNDPFVIDQAAKWAKALVTDGLDPAERIRRMFLRAVGREPTSSELQETLLYLRDLLADHEAVPDDATRRELAWKDLAQSIFCLKEFVYVH